MTVDMRGSLRKRSFIGALVTSPSGSSTFDCVLKDMSDGGARISVPSAQTIPTNCVLINLRDAIAHQAIVVWHHPPLFGLKLIDSHDLHGPLESKMLFAKNLWIARREQGSISA